MFFGGEIAIHKNIHSDRTVHNENQLYYYAEQWKYKGEMYLYQNYIKSQKHIKNR